jgi:hypothetical protein
MLLARPVIAFSGNHVRAVFSPHATVLNTLYATAMLQQEVPCEQRCAGSVRRVTHDEIADAVG